ITYKTEVVYFCQQNLKHALFSNGVRYLNAYLSIKEKELFPSPKGFYENKEITEGKKEIENVVIDGRFSEGNKRAGLGRYSYIEDETIYYYGVETNSDLKIKINLENTSEKRNVFRNEYIMPGHTFVGYIAVDDPDILEKIKNLFANELYLGNARSSGLGRCEVIKCEETAELPYVQYAVDGDMSGACYMLLLSNTAMRGEYGENAGLNIPVLQKKMDVANLRIAHCSTSTVSVSGYNRTLKGRTPSVYAYEMGSVFKFEFDGVFTADKARSLMDKGIGVNKNEGFGRILFLKDYEKVTYKTAGDRGIAAITEGGKEEEDTEIIKMIAGNYYRKILRKAMIQYVVNNPLKKAGINNSQVGAVESLISSNKYHPAQAKNVLEAYFAHANEKEDNTRVQQTRASIKGFGKTVLDILNIPLADTLKAGLSEEQKNALKTTVFGYDTKTLLMDEELKLKLELLLMLIRYDNKKGVR
ncbi:MAG: hypothetical protein Q4C91_23000, partial [Eubacteriales bacterium]|nr:hypothetical protein [Eubacteriales bacterium]